MSMYFLPRSGVMFERYGYGYPFPFLYFSKSTTLHPTDILVSVGSWYIHSFLADVMIVYLMVSGVLLLWGKHKHDKNIRKSTNSDK